MDGGHWLDIPRRHSRPVARNHPQLVKLEVLGHTGQGREIIAVKLAQGAGGQGAGTRPAVLFSETQHAREWISTRSTGG